MIDTIGYGHEDFKSFVIEEKLLNYLKDQSQFFTEINAILYVISIKARNSIQKHIKAFNDIKMFDIKANAIIILTEIDLIYKNDDFDDCLNEAYKMTDEIFGENMRNKVVLWINEHPKSKFHMKEILSTDGLKDIYKSQESQLLEAITKCKPFRLDALHYYYLQLKLLKLKSLLEILNSKNFQSEKKIIDMSSPFSFKLCRDPISTDNDLKLNYLGFFSLAHRKKTEIGFPELKIDPQNLLGSFIGIGFNLMLECVFFYLDIKHIKKDLNEKAELAKNDKNILKYILDKTKKNDKNFNNKIKGIENEMRNYVLLIMINGNDFFQISEIMRNGGICFKINKNINKRVNDVFNGYYEFEKIEVVKNNEFEFNCEISQNKRKVLMTWDKEQFKEYKKIENFIVKIEIEIKISIILPKEDLVTEIIETKILEQKELLWKESLEKFLYKNN